MKRKGFTLVELLVVIAIIALLMGLLMPALAMVQKMARRAYCGTQLSAIYKGLLTYAHEYRDDYPRAGGRGSMWNITRVWDARSLTEAEAFGIPASGTGGRATIGSSLYYLVKYADLAPKVYVCKGDDGAKEFKLSEFPTNNLPRQELRLAWDFGGPSTMANDGIPPANYYSYAYAIPYGGADVATYAPSTSRQPGFALMADRNPYFVLTVDAVPPVYIYDVKSPGDENKEKWGNSTNHQREGQNVLYNNGSVGFQKVPYCGVNSDNIYTMATGTFPQAGSVVRKVFRADAKPQNDNDSFLLNEGVVQGTIQVE